MRYALPLIHEYSIKVQLSILAMLLVASYCHRGIRFVLGGLATLYLAFHVLSPVVRWGFYAFKFIAMFGFYIHYFQIGVGIIVTGVAFVYTDGIDALTQALEQGRKARN
ncbi:hypothetical protein B0H34DRAFT_669173 [Crassisporium funariophilum]|nr:hypothetical protein B0H34DRAFT_669173 [Crassisporium funariophilum]